MGDRAGALTLAALAIGLAGLAQGIPALTHVNTAFVSAMLERDIPLEVILTEIFLSGEVEQTYGLLRKEGFARPLEHHSPASQHGQLSRRGSCESLDFTSTMRGIVDTIDSRRFADGWDPESKAGCPGLNELMEQDAGPGIRAMKADLRRRLGPGAHGDG